MKINLNVLANDPRIDLKWVAEKEATGVVFRDKDGKELRDTLPMTEETDEFILNSAAKEIYCFEKVSGETSMILMDYFKVDEIVGMQEKSGVVTIVLQ